MKYGASSSIVILDYDIIKQKFKVINRIEVPRSEYSYDNAVNLIIECNNRYNPSWIYCDRGSGEYQIERLHIYGDEHKETNLKNKVKGWQFKNTLDIIDPVTFEVTKEPMKPFMVNQMQILVEREKLILSPFDEVLYKQLIDYEVIRQSASGQPVFTDINEHFVDALGLAYLAFVLEFPDITRTVQLSEIRNEINMTGVQLGGKRLDQMFSSIQTNFNTSTNYPEYDPTDAPSDRQTMFRTSLYSTSRSHGNWGSRSESTRHTGGRSLW